MSISVLSWPHHLWDLYVEYLWNYKPGSWVDKTASTFRILAFLSVAPFALLTMLDVASYVIARTLGVIDETKASTREVPVLSRTNGDTKEEAPSIVVQDEQESAERSVELLRDHLVEEGNPKLSGMDAFSPAPSQPPSPTLSRRDLHSHMLNHQARLQPMTAIDGQPKLHSKSQASIGSSSGESSFAMLGGDTSGAEDGGVQIRRRVHRKSVSEALDA